MKAKEKATELLSNILKSKGLNDEMIELLKMILPLFIDFPKSKAASVVRILFDKIMEVDPTQYGNTEVYYSKLADLSQHIIVWCQTNNRSYLLYIIQTNLAEIMFKQKKYADAIAILSKLIYEIKRKEDKELLVKA